MPTHSCLIHCLSPLICIVYWRWDLGDFIRVFWNWDTYYDCFGLECWKFSQIVFKIFLSCYPSFILSISLSFWPHTHAFTYTYTHTHFMPFSCSLHRNYRKRVEELIRPEVGLQTLYKCEIFSVHNIISLNVALNNIANHTCRDNNTHVRSPPPGICLFSTVGVHH